MRRRAIRSGETDFVIAGGVESMTRAPLVMGKAQEAFQRSAQIEDTTIGWRFINPLMKKQYGVDAMPETAENVAEDYQVGAQGPGRVRAALAAARRQGAGRRVLRRGDRAGDRAGRQGRPGHGRQGRAPAADTTMEGLAKLKNFVRDPGTVTAGNASGVNDGAAAMLIASEAAVKKYGLKPLARITGMASAGVPPRVMGIGPVPSTRKLMERLRLKIGDFDVIELNEAFASQALACLRQLGLPDDAEHVNPNGGAIALGHPLGMSGTRLALTATHQMTKTRRQARARDDVRRRRAGRFAGDRAGVMRRFHVRLSCRTAAWRPMTGASGHPVSNADLTNGSPLTHP